MSAATTAGDADTPTGTPDTAPDLDRHDVRIVTDAPAVLLPFNLAGVLGPADVHIAAELCELVGEARDDVLLAAALAVRAPQHGHVCLQLADAPTTVTGVDEAPVAVDDLDWPELDHWRTALADSPLVSVREEGTPEDLDPITDRPLSLVGDRLYLDRYWRYERRVASILRHRAERIDTLADPTAIRAALDRLLPPSDDRPDRQRLAAASGVLRGLTVIAGGPGTGKTYTVARLLALLHEVTPDRPPRIALAAPTGKAADRLTAALRATADTLDDDSGVSDWLRGVQASTLHRLLGWEPSSHTRFWHNRQRRLPHDVVVVDETSMVDLPLMAKLLVALRPDTRLVLVGDPDQLASVEAGAVLADIVGPANEQLRYSDGTAQTMAEVTGEPLDERAPIRDGGIDDAIVVLGTVRRYAADSGVARLATAIHAGDGDEALDALTSDTPDLAWVDTDASGRTSEALAPVRAKVAGTFAEVLDAAQAGEAEEALTALQALRVLCAHRRGPVGVTGWVSMIERWLEEDIDGFDRGSRWYVGRPVLVTRNTPRLGLFNGDVGVTVRSAAHDDVQVAFRGSAGVRLLAPSRLEDIETVHAMTIHKSQGSQFEDVVMVLPDSDSPILTRELLYTGVTRASRSVTVVGTEDSIREAIARRVSRASGLRATLWPETPHT